MLNLSALSLDQWVGIASNALGRDFTKELNLYKRTRGAVNNALNPQAQAFLQHNWPQLVDFLETPDGQAAILMLLEAWGDWLLPKEMGKAPAVPPENPTETPVA